VPCTDKIQDINKACDGSLGAAGAPFSLGLIRV